MDPKESCLFSRNVFNRRSWTFISWVVWITAGGSYWLMPPHSMLSWGSVGLLTIVVVGETAWVLRSMLRHDAAHP